MIELLIGSLRLTAVFLTLLLGALIMKSEVRSFKKNILLVFLLCNIGYLLAYWPPILENELLFSVFMILPVAFPFTFWLVSKVLFDEEFRWSGNYTLLSIFVPLIHYTLYTINGRVTAAWQSSFKVIPYLITVIFILMVIYEAVRNKENDLVAFRLRTRNIFIVFASGTSLIAVYFFFMNDPLRLPVYFELFQVVLIITFILLFFYSQINFTPMFKYVVLEEDKKVKPEVDKRNEKVLDKLLTIFQNEKTFLQEGITITILSEIIEEKEYIVRKVINGKLGYTNFNAFLNHYRIREARQIIKEEEDFTFQEIAYRLGYQSVATFNRAFKKETGKTPTEYIESHSS